jgi:hypothetical protein
MSLVTYKTVHGKVTALLEEGQKLLYFKVKKDDKTIFMVDACLVFDLIVDGLASLENPKRLMGMDRRAYVARNIGRLTEEWLKKQEDIE